MPIVRSYMCNECAHQMTVTLSQEQWDDPPPECPECQRRQMTQDFKPVALGGSPRARAEKLTEDILEKDYHVGDIQRDNRKQAIPKVRYQDAGRPANASTWGIAREALEGAVQSGRKTRLKHGSGLDILQQNLKSGAEPDLIELSKRRAMRVW
jgi:DNA-directed RNA polymerase subunit RPC12/RpoP